jgi:peptidoglycan-associated lipoprotein
MRSSVAWIAIASAAFLLAGCPKSVNENPGNGSVVPGAGSGTANPESDASVSALPEGRSASAVSGGLLDRKVIYFDFDKSDIRPEFAEVIAAHAEAIRKNKLLKVTLQGNTDERGTREYNIGLGERRAQAVRRAMMLHGAPDSQITTVSFGEERPAVEGDDEAAWSQNRRVEIVYGR